MSREELLRAIADDASLQQFFNDHCPVNTDVSNIDSSVIRDIVRNWIYEGDETAMTEFSEIPVQNTRREQARLMMSDFNRPHKPSVAVDTSHIGDDNDFSCFLSGIVVKLYKAGHIEDALKLANIDPMINNAIDADGLAQMIESRDNFDEQQKAQSEANWKNQKYD